MDCVSAEGLFEVRRCLFYTGAVCGQVQMWCVGLELLQTARAPKYWVIRYRAPASVVAKVPDRYLLCALRVEKFSRSVF